MNNLSWMELFSPCLLALRERTEWNRHAHCSASGARLQQSPFPDPIESRDVSRSCAAFANR
jgi:hypothetical protein